MHKKIVKKDGTVGTYYRLDFFMGAVQNLSTVKLKSKTKSKPPNNEIAKKRNKTKQVRQKVVEEDVISHLTIENEN